MSAGKGRGKSNGWGPLSLRQLIDEFVPRSELDDLYLVRPYYIVPDGKVGHDAFAVIRDSLV